MRRRRALALLLAAGMLCSGCTTETFTDAPSLPPQRSGYIELVCMVPTGWQQITVTYTPTFVTNKTLTFSLSASDVAKA